MTILGFTIISGSDNPCNKCLEHIDDYYEDANDLPKIHFHPNCRCHYEADSEERSQLDEYKKAYEELAKKGFIMRENNCKIQITTDEITKINDNMQKAFSYLDDDMQGNWSKAYSDFYDTLFKYEDTYHRFQGFFIFLGEYFETLNANVFDGDNVYHSLANARLAQKSAGGEDMATVLSNIKEAWDLSEKLKKHETIISRLKDVIKDLYNNKTGRMTGKNNREDPLNRTILFKEITDQKFEDGFITKDSHTALEQVEQDKKDIKRLLRRRVPFTKEFRKKLTKK